MRRLNSPIHMITDHCFPSLDSLSDTPTLSRTKVFCPYYRQTCFAHGTWKGESLSFGIRLSPASSNIAVISTEAKGQSQGPALSVLRAWHTHIHNDYLWQQCQLGRRGQATSICLPCLVLTQLEAVMNGTSHHVWYNFFSIPEQKKYG